MTRPNPMDSIIFQKLFTGDNAIHLLTTFMNDYFSTTKATEIDEIKLLGSDQSLIPSVSFEAKGKNRVINKKVEMQVITKEHLGEEFQAYWGKIMVDELKGNEGAGRVLKIYLLDFELFKTKDYMTNYQLYSPVHGTNLDRVSVNMEFFELPKIDKLSVRKVRSLWNDKPFLKWLVFLSSNANPQLLKEAILLNEGIREAEEMLQETGRNLEHNT